MAAKIETHQLTVDGTPYVIGMEWRVGVASRLAADMKNAFDSTGSKVGVVLKSTAEARIGLARPADAGKLSGAAVLAHCQKNVMLVQQISPDLYWFTYVIRGMVYPRSDYVGTLEKVNERIKDVASKVTVMEKDMRLCAPGLSNIESFQKFEPTDFITLIGPYQATKQETIKNIAPAMTRTRAIAVVFLLVLGYVVWSSQHHGKVTEAITQAVTPAPAPTMSNEARMQKLAVLISGQLATDAPVRTDQTFSEVLNKYWPSRGGWELDAVSVGEGGAGTVSLKRTQGATVEDLVTALGLGGQPKFSDDGESADVTVQSAVSNAGGNTLLSLNEGRDSHLHLESDFQANRLDGTLKLGSLDTASPGMNVRQALLLGPTDPIPLQVYEWEVRVTYPSLDSVFSILKKYPTLGVTRISYKRATNSETVVVTGVLYEPL